MTQTAQRAPVKWVTDKYLSEYFQVSRVTVWRWVRIGRLPAPQKIGENSTRWDFDVITAAENAA